MNSNCENCKHRESGLTNAMCACCKPAYIGDKLVGSKFEPTTSEPEQDDMVNHPAHYTQGEVEVIDFIEQTTKAYSNGAVAYELGNVIKYVSRAPFKGHTLEDLKKALWYLLRAIGNLEE